MLKELPITKNFSDNREGFFGITLHLHEENEALCQKLAACFNEDDRTGRIPEASSMRPSFL